MKKIILKFAAIIFVAGFTTTAASAQHFYVKVRPTARVIVRPAAPSPRHVWVGSEWSWRNGHYVEVPAHWIVPPYGMRTWVPGYWNDSRSGSEWIGGHWAS